MTLEILSRKSNFIVDQVDDKHYKSTLIDRIKIGREKRRKVGLKTCNDIKILSDALFEPDLL